MSNVVLSLGNVAFRDMEVPETIQFGGQQRLAVQNLIGGGRVVEALGLDDGTISFSGIFTGNDAIARAQLLDAARAAGAQLPLVWQGFYYLVVISKFTAEYRKPIFIPFSVACVVVNDPLASAANAVAPVANLIAADLAAAVGLSGLAGLDAASLGGGSAVGLAAAQALVTGAVSGSGAALDGGSAALEAATTPRLGVSALGQIGRAAGQLAASAGMAGYVNRAAANFGLEL